MYTPQIFNNMYSDRSWINKWINQYIKSNWIRTYFYISIKKMICEHFPIKSVNWFNLTKICLVCLLLFFPPFLWLKRSNCSCSSNSPDEGTSREFFSLSKTHSATKTKDKTEMIYRRLRPTKVPRDPGGPHTEKRDGPFMRPIEAAQTGPEARGLWSMRRQKKKVSFHFRCQMASNVLAFPLTETKATVSTHLISI